MWILNSLLVMKACLPLSWDTHALITALYSTPRFLYVHYLSCKSWCQYIDQGNSSQLVCLLGITGLVKHVWLESTDLSSSPGSLFTSGWPWLNCLTPKQSSFLNRRRKVTISLIYRREVMISLICRREVMISLIFRREVMISFPKSCCEKQMKSRMWGACQHECFLAFAHSNKTPEFTCFCTVRKNTLSEDIWELSVMWTKSSMSYF